MRTSPRFISLWIVLIAAVGAPGCVLETKCSRGAVEVSGDCVCPAGTSSVAAADGTSSCVAVGTDAGPGDLGVDAGPADAGPCGMACPTGTPVCDEASGTCVECTGTDARACGGATPVCDVPSHACVACNADSDCTALDAPQCDVGAHACVACTTSDACAARVGTTVCDAVAGACVECTPTAASACGANVCRPTEHTCTTLPARAQYACQECAYDEQCQVGQLCVATTYGDPPPDRSVGSYCLWRRDATAVGAPNGACGFGSQPFASARMATSTDGVAAAICDLRTATCPALLEHATTVPGCATAFTDDAACGAAGFNDGRCRLNGSSEPKCSYPCLGTEDCPAGATCPAAGDRFCSI